MVRVAILTPWNSARGQMAEAFLRYYGGDALETYGGGTAPSGLVRPEAIRVMEERGMPLTPNLLPKPMLTQFLREADYIIFMGTLARAAIPKDLQSKAVEWKIEDPLGTEPERWVKVRDEIERNAKEFVDRMVKEKRLPARR